MDAALHKLKNDLNLKRFELRNMLDKVLSISDCASYGLLKSNLLNSK